MAGERFGLNRRELTAGLVILPLAACHAPRRDEDGAVIRKRESSQPTGGVSPGQLVELLKLDPSIRLDMRYATTNNFTGRVLYEQPRAFLARIAAEALVRAHRNAKADGFGITIFDAYRPWQITKALWDATPPGPQRNYVANPKRDSRHNRGCAVDITLHRLADGKIVEMPSGFDDFSAKAHRKYEDDSANARRHARLLEGYMEGTGFIGLSNEWWHFDHKDWAKYPVQDVAFSDIGQSYS
ncbi:MAG: M15 family metallopeptidase [Sphingorhabdus sp.]